MHTCTFDPTEHLFPSSLFHLQERGAVSFITLKPAAASRGRLDEFTLREVRRLAAASAFHRL